jgi:hypothetical protein
MKEFKIKKDRAFLMKRMGDISQLAGVKRMEFTEGKAKGVESVDFKTGTGFNFTVLPGRGMDIAWADYRGVPISYMSKTGIVSPAYYESDGMGWLRNFFAGLLTTCGLSNVGGPCEHNDPVIGLEQHGLHGRISNMAAEHVCVKEEWQENEFIMTVSGRMRESRLHGENLTLTREVVTKLGQNSLTIHDVIENEGFSEKPLMILYHINIGYPVIDDGSRIVCNSQSKKPANPLAVEKLHLYDSIQSPTSGAMENVYFHDLKSGSDGTTLVGVINDSLEMGIYIQFNKNQLNNLTQWKQLSESEYVLGIEPANCIPQGREAARMQGELQTIKPGEIRKVDLEIGVLTDKQQIENFEKVVKSLQ